jgi:AcrR family transcriptional regulator
MSPLPNGTVRYGIAMALDLQRSDPITNTTRAPRGRPRDPLRDRAILDAARTVLATKGFTGASMDEIARTAGVGKDTLYRRWDSKEQLVQRLLEQLADEGVRAPVLDDDPGVALFLLLQDIVRLNTESDFGAIVAGVVGESARNPQLAETFRAFWSDRREITAARVRLIVGSFAAPPEIERILDHVLGPIYYRLLLSGAPITDEYLWGLVTAIPSPEPTRTTPASPATNNPPDEQTSQETQHANR